MAPRDQDPADRYSTLMMLVRLRPVLPAAAAVLVLAAFAWAAYACAQPLWLVPGVVAGAIVFVAMRALVELLELVTDLLVPR